jgi:hypothetical protein
MTAHRRTNASDPGSFTMRMTIVKAGSLSAPKLRGAHGHLPQSANACGTRPGSVRVVDIDHSCFARSMLVHARFANESSRERRRLVQIAWRAPCLRDSSLRQRMSAHDPEPLSEYEKRMASFLGHFLVPKVYMDACRTWASSSREMYNRLGAPVLSRSPDAITKAFAFWPCKWWCTRSIGSGLKQVPVRAHRLTQTRFIYVSRPERPTRSHNGGGVWRRAVTAV